MDAQYTGNQIARLRRDKNLTQRRLAEMLHVTDKAVSKWERGVNFPDLGIMEELAKALDTTPAALLGLENTDQAGTLSALAEISQAQLEEAQSDLRAFSWGSVVTALLLVLTYALLPRNGPGKYYLLTALILLTGTAGLLCLFRYGEIKKWGVPELGSFFGAVFSQLVFQGYLFTTGDSAPLWLGIVTMVLTGLFAQVHFRQVMKPRLLQYLPLLLSLGLTAWDWSDGQLGYAFPCVLGGCLLGLLLGRICGKRQK